LCYQLHIHHVMEIPCGFFFWAASPVVRLSEIAHGLNSQPGLSHIVLAGANNNGMKEVEVWLTTYAPGSGTPIHRHACEEVFFVLKGSGTLYISPASDALFPGKPQTFPIYPNSTFIVPVDSVHQVRNTMDSGDLQAVIALSRPPMKVYLYKDWNTAHEKANFFDFASVEQHRSIPQYYRASEPEAHQEL
jgi:mannose-6-phosphate isomerase-like protein (cupin superfamily)